MDEFKKELQALLVKHPEIEDISFTAKQTVTVSRITSAEVAKNVSVVPVPLVSDEGRLLDMQAKAQLAKTMELAAKSNV